MAICISVFVGKENGVVDGVVGAHVVPDVKAVGDYEEDGCDAGDFEDGGEELVFGHGGGVEGGVEGCWN